MPNTKRAVTHRRYTKLSEILTDNDRLKKKNCSLENWLQEIRSRKIEGDTMPWL